MATKNCTSEVILFARGIKGKPLQERGNGKSRRSGAQFNVGLVPRSNGRHAPRGLFKTHLSNDKAYRNHMDSWKRTMRFEVGLRYTVPMSMRR